ncbi:MAG: thioredoxin domain-containing protein, partial [Planctomycetota bacterium]
MKGLSLLFLAGLAVGGLFLATEGQSNSQEGDKTMNASSNSVQETEAERSSPQHVNRLAKETSPYLLQHARNPVEWYPWSAEALRRAKEENKPIFLSIGYSACHWCHVMERESFEDPETARILNAHFIAIKVDREERPDLDEIYMTAVQVMTGQGGWPLSVFLTPDLKPFYGGTYFPPEDRFGMPSFKKVLNRMAEVWRAQPDDVAHNAEQMVVALRANAAPAPASSGALDDSIFSSPAAQLVQSFDPNWGGFGGEPKFPSGAAIAFLLRQQLCADRSLQRDLLAVATVTLDRMAHGGIHDQIGGGFHRYSVDAQWLVPHFEKMLYDNAILGQAYLEAYQATGKDLYRRVAAGIFDYVLRDMTDSRGGFHSAEDADSEGEEGKFYVWRPEEITAVLGEEEGGFFCRCYGVSEEGNFEGSNILHVPRDREAFLRAEGISEAELEGRLAPLRRKLLAVRDKRVRPAKDDKVLAAWNGMMISAFARGYQVLGDQRYRSAAEGAADFVLAQMVREGVLLRTYRAAPDSSDGGTSKLPAYLDDYAEMAGALVDLYEATFELRWLEAADELAGRMVADFWDQEEGGFFYTSAAHKDLLVRTKPFFDGAVPSGNSVATLVLVRLGKLLDNQDYLAKAERVLVSMRDAMVAQPRAHLDLLSAADFYLRPTR